MHADGGDLFAVHPHTGQPGHATTFNSQFREGVDDRLLHAAYVGDHIPLPFSQIEDRITHNLPGAVIGDVAAAVGLVKFDAGALEQFPAYQNIFRVAVAAHSDDMRMLYE